MEVISLKDYSPVEQEDILIKCKALQEAIKDETYSIEILNVFGASKEEKTIKVFDTYANKYFVQEYVGILAHDNEQFVIQSRFDDDDKQYFLNYVFCKAYNLNSRIFKEMNPDCAIGQTWDILLIILFFEKLEEAFKKDYYKEYRKILYNDPKLKGPINIARHIKENMLFSGNIAYSRREDTINNPINTLILTTLQYIDVKYNDFSQTILEDKPFLKDYIEELSFRVPLIQIENRREMLKETSKPVTRHIFKDYESVRVLARLILKNMGMNIFDNSDSDVKGVLINMEKLWENFLEQTFFEEKFLAERNLRCEAQDGKNILFSETDEKNFLRTLKPDFLLKESDQNTNKAVLDAKYKEYIKETDKTTTPDVKRNDVFQVLTYKLAYNVDYCGVIFPVKVQDTIHQIEAYKLLDTDTAPCFYTIPIVVPQGCKNFADFCEQFDKHIMHQKDFFLKLQMNVSD